jgi:hypothetical protein
MLKHMCEAASRWNPGRLERHEAITPGAMATFDSTYISHRVPCMIIELNQGV